MKNFKRSLIITSLLLILLLSLGSISASENDQYDNILSDNPQDNCLNVFSDSLSDSENEDISDNLKGGNFVNENDDSLSLAESDEVSLDSDNDDDLNLIDGNGKDSQLTSSNLGINVIPIQHTGNDARDIQTAINTANHGDIIYFGEYHYYIDFAQINVTKELRLQGELGKTIIEGYGYNELEDGNASTGVMMLIAAQDVVLDGIIFNNTAPNMAYTDWDTLYGWAVRINRKNVNVTNCSFINLNHGIYTAGDNTVIRDCYFTGTTTRIMNSWDSGKERGTKAIHLSEASNVLIQNNIFDGPMLDSILLDYDCLGAKILNNQFINNSYSIYFYGYDDVGGEYMGATGIIANNTFTNCGHFEDANYYGGIAFTYLPVICAEQTILYNLDISENTFNVRNKTIIIAGPDEYPRYILGGLTVNKNKVYALDESVEPNTVALFYDSAGLIKDFTYLIQPISFTENELLDGMYSAVFDDYGNEEYWISYFNDLVIPVNGIPTTIIINSHDVEAGKDNKIDFYFLDGDSNNLNGKIYVWVNDDVYTVNITNGEGSLMLNNLSKGNYTVYAGFGGNLTHYSVMNESNFTVWAKESYLTLDVDNITSGEILNINIRLFDEYSEGLNATVSVNLNNTIYEVNTTNGIATLKVQGLVKEGNYTVNAIFDGDNIYSGCNKSANFTVFPTDSYLYLSASNVVSGNPVNLNINLTDLNGNLLNGTVYVKANGRTYQVTISRGKGSIRLDGLVEVGNYTITVDYLGDGSQISSSSSIIVEVYGRETASSISLVKRGEGLYEANIALSSNSKPLSKYVTLMINGKVYENIYLNNGNALVVLDHVFEIGDNNVTVNYYGDSIYLPSSSFVILSYGDNLVSVSHTGNDQLDIQNAIDIANPGDIIDLGSYAYSNVSDLIISKDLTFIGDGASFSSLENQFNNSIFVINKDNVSLNVSKVLFKLNNDDKVILVNVSESQDISLKLTDNVFTALNDDVIAESISVISLGSDSENMGLDDFLIKDNTLDAGISLLPLSNANVNERLATVIHYENMNTVAVDQATDGRAGEYFNFKLTDADGNPIANAPMQIGFLGVVYGEEDGIITDENGVAKLQINLGYKNDYTFAICFLGNEKYNASFVVAKINVVPQKGSLTVPNKSYSASAKTKTLTATFKSASGKPVAGKKITFTVNGKTYSAKTNSKGVASVNVSLSKKGTYSFTAKFETDGMYATMTKTAKLTIK